MELQEVEQALVDLELLITSMPGPLTSPLASPTGITVTATTYPITVGGGGSAPGPNAVQAPLDLIQYFLQLRWWWW